MPLYLGIDSGTQSIKAVVLSSEDRSIVAESRGSYELIPGLPPGHMEQHPQDWVRAAERVIEDVLARVSRADVVAIGISGQQHGLVALDDKGEVIRPAKLWCDTSTTEECAILTKMLGGDKAVIRRLGNRFLPGFTAPKILWLKRHEPRNYRRLRHVLLPHDYLNWHLTGNTVTECGDASGTALFDVRKRQWSEPVIRAIGAELADCLPMLINADEPAGTLRPDLAAKFGLRSDVVVSAGGGDNMMGAIGTGNVVSGVVSASLGTSGTIYAYSRKAIVDPPGEIASFCDSTGAWLPLLCTMNVTGVTEKMRNLFAYDYSRLDAAVDSTAPGASGLAMLPYLLGERTPSIPDGTGVLFGLNAHTLEPAHVLRAAMEGVTLGMNYGLQRLRALGIRPKEIRLTGGGSKSSVWRQIAADVFGVPVVAMREDEGAAVGAAIQAAWCFARHCGRQVKIADLAKTFVAPDEATRARPRPGMHRRYLELQKLHDELSIALRPLFRRHAKMTPHLP